jgi:hypothetical protein
MLAERLTLTPVMEPVSLSVIPLLLQALGKP